MADAPVSVKIIGLNDFHGNLEAPGGSVVVQDAANPAGTRVSAGGAAYLAALIQTLKAKNPNNVVVAAGDMVGASPLVSGAFHEEPAIDVLGQMGLEISSVGNHEFDKGRDELLRLQNGGCFPRSADGRRGIVGVDTCMTNGAYAGRSSSTWPPMSSTRRPASRCCQPTGSRLLTGPRWPLSA
ncbi:hypothetical protein CBM2637_B110437 [Cupriavidus taiwanensis]|nr:hypothetical protein CBM2637_B110437 [Cupriavidus taiwanensis]